MKTFEEAVRAVISESPHHTRLEWSDSFTDKYGRKDDLLHSQIYRQVETAAKKIIHDRFMQPGMSVISIDAVVGDLVAFALCCTEIGIAIGMEMEKNELH